MEESWCMGVLLRVWWRTLYPRTRITVLRDAQLVPYAYTNHGSQWGDKILFSRVCLIKPRIRIHFLVVEWLIDWQKKWQYDSYDSPKRSTLTERPCLRLEDPRNLDGEYVISVSQRDLGSNPSPTTCEFCDLGQFISLLWASVFLSRWWG